MVIRTGGAILFAVLLLAPVSFAQQQTEPGASPPSPPAADQSSAQKQSAQQSGMLSGIVVDPSGTPVAGADVSLSRGDGTPKQEVLSGDDGQFYLVNVPPGPYQLSVTATGFAGQSISGTLQPGDVQTVPKIALAVATVVTEVRVSPPTFEIAEGEIKEQEKQRVLGVVPNFYVTYDPSAAPLAPRQKFELAWKTTIDPVTFGIVGGVAGFQQAEDYFNGYGQGAQGYAKRYGASYANTTIGVMLGGAVLPSLLKQDPRYFYKGTGTKRSRVLYAMANALICKGDNGRWQPNYSSVLGSLAAGGISNLYYAPQDRDGLELTFENTLIGIGENAGENLLQEFVIRKLTPNKGSNNETSQP